MANHKILSIFLQGVPLSYLHTKILMLSSALFMTVLGLIATFAPKELLASTGSGSQGMTLLLVQAAGGLYLGFAFLNWMAKDNLIGGVYSRPVAMGNLLHFFIVAMALLRVAISTQRTNALTLATILYAAFAIWFGLVAFTNPLRKTNPAN
jgi:hypothetical protein